MKLVDLVQHWEDHASEPRTEKIYSVQLPKFDAAKIKALAEMFPGRSEEQIITDLLSAALDQLHESLPYRKGEKIIAEDEMGDPIFEDAGLSKQLHNLTDELVMNVQTA